MHTKSKSHCPSEDFKVFLPYMCMDAILVHGRHLGHMTLPICINVRSSALSSLHMQLEFNWFNGFLENMF